MAHKETIEVRLAAWVEEEQAQPLLLTGAGANVVATSFTKKLDGKTTEILELSSDSSSLKVKEVRELLLRLHHTALTKRRIIIIPGAERLLPASANALLKELEETGKQNRFLLVTAYPGRLLATIRSRCQTVRVAAEKEVAIGIGQLPSFDPKRKIPLTTEEISAIAGALQQKLAKQGPTPELRRSFLRLRDYYKIQALRGNTRLAADVLLASLPNLQDT
ncbi:MAG: hypothetical protein HYR90_03525 [Candidatus Andersenbacteria bacterium]|nr:hypothetical protein [Candidatus Andersenbacteria bacterium]MBI3250336.1 hypothetical protein [Candidatus Andersenbacteria bacterium]